MSFVEPQVVLTSNIEKVPISNITHSLDNNFIAYNLYNKLNVYDTKSNKFVELDSNSQHTENIRSIEFSKDNKFLVSTSSDKSIKVWDCTNEFKNTKTININKKVICSVLNKDDTDILVSDKCGDVFCYSLVDDSKNKIEIPTPNKPGKPSNGVVDKSAKHDERESDKNLIFGHYSSIVDMKFSPCFDFVLSADRDEKIRVSKYPNSFDVERFCLGHSKYVTRVVFVPNKPELLVSGSGDGTIKLWDWKMGKCLQTVDFNDKKAHQDLGSITIPQVFNTATNELVFSIENSFNIFVLPLNLESNQFVQSDLKTIAIPSSSPISIDLVSNGQVLLASLLPSSKDVDVAIAVDVKSYTIQADNIISKSINSVDSTTNFKPNELKSILESIEKKQYRKHVSYSKKPENNTNGKNKKGGDDDDLSLDEQDIDNGDGEKKKESTIKDDRPLKLRKMTVEGDKEIQKELKEKEELAASTVNETKNN